MFHAECMYVHRIFDFKELINTTNKNIQFKILQKQEEEEEYWNS